MSYAIPRRPWKDLEVPTFKALPICLTLAACCGATVTPAVEDQPNATPQVAVAPAEAPKPVYVRPSHGCDVQPVVECHGDTCAVVPECDRRQASNPMFFTEPVEPVVPYGAPKASPCKAERSDDFQAPLISAAFAILTVLLLAGQSWFYNRRKPHVS